MTKPHAAKPTDRYKVGIVFINDYSKGSTLKREAGSNPMHYRYCSSLKRARALIIEKYGAGTNAPVISLADIYDLTKAAGAPPLARWTIEKEWNTVV